MANRGELFDKLKRLSPAQFEEVLFRLEIEPWIIPGAFAEQSVRAKAVIQRLEQEQEGLVRLETTLAEPAISIIGEQYIGYEIDVRVKQIVSEYTQQPFEGREKEKRRLDEFVMNNSSGVLLVTAAAGFGKSALLSHWQQTRQEDCFIAYHCFSYRYEKTRLVSEAYRHLLKQLYLYYNIRNGQFPNDENGMRDILIGMLREPVPPEGKRLVIVLDGLDEASKTFEPFFTLLPAGVFVIASARAEEGEKPEYLRNWTDNAQRLPLKRLPREAIPKWLEQISELATYSQDDEFIKSLDETTGGFPLYLRYLIDDLRQAATQSKDVREVLAETPKGFEGYVEQQLKRLDELDLPEQRWQFFALLAVAKGVLEKEDIKALTQMRDRELRQLRQSWQVTRWMQITEDKFYAFAHPLLAKTFGDKLGDDAEEALQDLINYCAKWQEHHSAYALRYYAQHLGDVKQWEELYNLLTEFEYIYTKVSVLGSQPLIEDYDWAFKTNLINSEQDVNFNVENLKLIQGTLRLSAHILAEDKRQLAGRLWGHLQRFDAPEIQRLLLQAKQWKATPWLRPFKNNSLIPPGGCLLRTLIGHTNWVTAVAMTPDGHWALSGSEDHTLKMWDLKSGKEVHTLTGHRSAIYALAVTPDGRWALSGSDDGTLKLWDLERGKEVYTLTGHTDWVRAVAMTPDRRWAVSSSWPEGSRLKLWDLGNGREVHTFTGHQKVTAVAMTPDGHWALSGSEDHTLKMWDLKSGKEVRTLTGHRSAIYALAVTPDGRWALSGSNDKTLKLWNLENGQEVRTLTGHTSSVFAVALTPDSRWAISSSADNTLKLWNLKNGQEIRTLTGHTNFIRDVAITSNGSLALSGSDDKTLKLWDLTSSVEPITVTDHALQINGVAVLPDRQWALSASADTTLKLWNLESGKEIRTLMGHSHSVAKVAVTPDGQRAISASLDTTLKLWNLENGKAIYTFTEHSDKVYAVAMTPDGRWVVSGSADKTLKLWDLSNNILRATLNGHTGDVNAVAVTPDGRWAVSGSDDKTLKLWNLTSGKLINTFIGHDGWIMAVAMTPDGRWAVSGSLDKTIKLWDLVSGTERSTLVGHGEDITGVAITSDGRYAISTSYDYTLKVWDLQSSKMIASFSDENVLFDCAIAPDGVTIVAGGRSGQLHFLHLEGM